MLGGLRGVDQCRIQHRFVRDLAGGLIGFLDDAVDGGTVDRLRLGPMHLEHLFEALNVRFGFIEMGQETLLELLVCRLLGHFRKRFHKLLLGIIDVLQLIHEQVVHRLDVSGKESHCSHPFCSGNTTARAVPASASMFDCRYHR